VAQQLRSKRLRNIGFGAIAASVLMFGVVATPAFADEAPPEETLIVEEVITPDATEEVVEEEATPEETTTVPEEVVTEESVDQQISSTQAAKNDGEQGQETCPDGGGWLKIEPIDALTYEYTAPGGQLIAEVCYKASTDVIYIDIEDAASYEFVSTVTNKNGELQQISHVSVRLITEEPTGPTGQIGLTCVEEDWEFNGEATAGSNDETFYLLFDDGLVEEQLVLAGETYVFNHLGSDLSSKGEGDSFTGELRAGETLETSVEISKKELTIDCEDDTPPPPPPPGEDPDPVKELADTGDETLWVGLGLTAALFTFGFWAVRKGRRQSIAGVLAE
jgi:hypothetical protein